MTLDITKFIANSIRAQAKIQHLDIQTKTVATDDIPASIKTLIAEQYGKKYLMDADYTAFFWGAIDREQIDRLFNVVDKALGKSANRLTNTDFKKINLDSSSNDEEEPSDEEPKDVDEPEDVEITEEPEKSDVEATKVDADEPTDDADVDDSEEDVEVTDSSNDTDEEDATASDEEDKHPEDDESKDELNEDDETIDAEVVVEKPVKPSYFFLKITMK